MPNRDSVESGFPAAHSAAELLETIATPAATVRRWLRQALPRPGAAVTLADDAIELNPMQLVIYLARRGWRPRCAITTKPAR